MSLRSHAFWSASAAIVLTGSRFLLVAILARRLTEDAFGQYAYAQWLIDISFLVLAFGATGAASRYVSEFRQSAARVSQFLRAWRPFALLLPIAAAVAATVSAIATGLDLTLSGLVFLGVWSFSAGLWAMQTAALAGLQRFDLIFRANAVAAALIVGGAIFLPLEQSNLTPIMALMACASLAAFATGFSTVSRAASHQAHGVMRNRSQILRYALNVWITALLWSLVWSRGEIPIVRSFLGDSAVAHYSVVLTLLGGAIAGVMLGLSGFAQQVTRFLGEGRQAEAIHLCRKVMDIQLVVSGVCCLLLVWLGPESLQYAFGSAYAGTASVLLVLILSLPTLALSMHNHLLQITTDSRFNRNATLVGLIVLIGSAMFLVPMAGILGAATARTSTLGLLALVTITAFWMRFGHQGLGLKNLSLVFGITIPSAIFMLQWPATTIQLRLLLLLATLVILGFGVRDTANRSMVLVTVKTLLPRRSHL